MIVRSLTMFVICILTIAVNVLAAPDLSQEERQLITLVAELNRANQHVLRSFDAHYTMSIKYPPGRSPVSRELIEKSGRYAFSGERVYGREEIAGTRDYMHYVRKGSNLQMASQENPRLIATATQGYAELKPGSPSPWGVACGDVAVELDHLPAKYGEIRSARREIRDNRSYVVVIIEQGTKSPHGEEALLLRTLRFSLEDGGLLIACDMDVFTKGTRRPVLNSGVLKIGKFDIDGQAVFVPILYEEKVVGGDDTGRVTTYEVKEESVRINPTLPDDLFELNITAADQVRNLDLEMEIVNPFTGMDWLTQAGTGSPAAGRAQNLNFVLDMGDGVEMETVFIPPGDARIGSPDSEIGVPDQIARLQKSGKAPTRDSGEGPQIHKTIPNGFYLGKYEITVAQFRRFRADYRHTPIYDGNKSHAIDRVDQPCIVTWNEAKAFCRWLSDKSGRRVRLPTEVEWEYACRAGSETRFFWGDDDTVAVKYGNVADDAYLVFSPGVSVFPGNDGYAFAAPVGHFKPNAWGLFDMIGNVEEWCEDEYRTDAYSQPGTSTQTGLRVLRGGSWTSDVQYARCAARHGADPSDTNLWSGFRILMEADSGVTNSELLRLQNAAPTASPSKPWYWITAVIVVAFAFAFFFVMKKVMGRGSRQVSSRKENAM